MKPRFLLLLPTMAAVAIPVPAVTEIFTDRTLWEAAVSGPILTETFDSLPPIDIPFSGTVDLGPLRRHNDE